MPVRRFVLPAIRHSVRKLKKASFQKFRNFLKLPKTSEDLEMEYRPPAGARDPSPGFALALAVILPSPAVVDATAKRAAAHARGAVAVIMPA